MWQFSEHKLTLNCLNVSSPEIRKHDQASAKAEGLRFSGAQWINPKVAFESTKGKSLGDTVGTTRVIVSQVFELGGKISSRSLLSKVEADAVMSSAHISRAQAESDNALMLLRLRQVVSEIAVLDEALATYLKVQNQFSSRPKLSPEQQVSFGIFKLASGDYRHRITKLESERRKIENQVRSVIGLEFEKIKPLLPRRITKWPVLAGDKVDISNSHQMRELKYQARKAEAGVSLASANVWPDIELSLIAENSVEGTDQHQRYGLGIALPLPIWNWNTGERRQAAADLYKIQFEIKKAETDLELEKRNLVKSYEDFVQVLRQSPTEVEMDRKHRSTEQLFYQGLISGALVIEAHRQILDFTQTQNELEYETLQTLLKIYSLTDDVKRFQYE